MNRLYCLFLLLLLLFACSDDLRVTTGSEPGSVSGRIYPREGGATVGLYQSVINLIDESESKSDGTFLVEDVPPGNYLLKISASGYGRFEIEDVEVSSGGARDVGEIMLSKLPWPLISSNIDRIEQEFPVSGSISFRVSQDLDEENPDSGVTITPGVPGFEVIFSRKSLWVLGDWDYLTDYAVHLDTTIRTTFGYPLEFPWTQSFMIEPFRIKSIVVPPNWAERSSVNFKLNGEVEEKTVNENVLITPDISFDTVIRVERPREFRVLIDPRERWPTGITSLTFKKGLTELGGSTLISDTTITLEMNLMEVVYTIPSDGETSASDSLGIDIRFNAPLNIETAQNAVSLNPSASFSVAFGPSDEYLFVSPDSDLQSATTYTVTIDTSLRDIWGNPMDQPYQFSFTTK